MIERDSAIPLYEQVKQHLRQSIGRGELPLGHQAPSERQLVERLGVSRITVRRALGDLVHEGVLYSVPGRGFFASDRAEDYELQVLRGFREEARLRGRVATCRVLEARLIAATPEQALNLGVAEGDEIVSLRRLRLIDDAPAVLQHAWLPHAACPGLLDHDFSTNSLFATLTDRHGIQLGHGNTLISARLAAPDEAELLEMSSPAAVLAVDQLTYRRDGRPIELLWSLHNPRRFSLSLRQGEPGGRGGVMPVSPWT